MAAVTAPPSATAVLQRTASKSHVLKRTPKSHRGIFWGCYLKRAKVDKFMQRQKQLPPYTSIYMTVLMLRVAVLLRRLRPCSVCLSETASLPCSSDLPIYRRRPAARWSWSMDPSETPPTPAGRTLTAVARRMPLRRRGV